MDDQPLKQGPKVSVLMTVYNAALYLREAIDSIVGQSFADWELIAVENGSTDDSPAILGAFGDERVRAFYLPENIGRTPALRFAFDQARGDYIAVLDADDVSLPERLAKQVLFLDRHPEVGMVGSWVTQIDRNGKEIGTFNPPTDEQELLETMGWTNPFVHSSIMYRANLARQVGGYPLHFVYAQDLALIQLMSRISMFGMMGEALCKYRIVATSMTQKPQMSLIIGKEQLILLCDAAQHMALSKRSEKRNRVRQAVSKIKIGVALVRQRKPVEGMGYIAAAIIREPASIFANGMVSRLLAKYGGRKEWT